MIFLKLILTVFNFIKIGLSPMHLNRLLRGKVHSTVVYFLILRIVQRFYKDTSKNLLKCRQNKLKNANSDKIYVEKLKQV